MNLEKELTRVWDLYGEGSWAQARAMAERALAVSPHQAQLWFALGASLHALGERPGAIDAFRKTAELAPAFVPALNALATVLTEEGQTAQALDILDRAVVLAPSDAPTLFNRGIVLERLARLQDSLAAYDAAIAVDASFAPARLNRGAVLMVLGCYENAVDNNRRLVALQPDAADAHVSLAEALLGLGLSQEALGACDRAIELDPRHAQAHVDRGLALSDLGQFEDAQHAFNTADAISPGAMRKYINTIAPADPSLDRTFDPRLVFLYRGYHRLMLCDWSMRDLYIERTRELVMEADAGTTARIDLPLAYHSLTVPLPPEVPHRIACVIGDRYAAAVALTGQRFTYKRRRDRIRIGYLSADFCEHLNAYLSYPLFRLHARERFEVVAYSIGPDDGAEIRARIRSTADRFVDLRNTSDLEAARLINSDEIDVLVDFGGYTEHCRPGIAAFRPAPVQLAHIGFPGTMGAPWMDYRITDRIATPPEQEKFWREKLVFMPGSFFIYDNEQAMPAEPVTRAEYGLPDGAFVFCSHNNSYKIDPEIFSVWMSLLRELPEAVLWLVARDTGIQVNLRAEARARGVDPARLLFAPHDSRQRYFSRYRLADLFLDTPQFTAATTACDALWMGLPLLSIRRDHFTSRQAASILSALGMADLIVETIVDYRRIAVRFATRPEELRMVRQRLANARSDAPMFRTQDYVRGYEGALDAMVARWHAGEPPANLHVLADGSVRAA